MTVGWSAEKTMINTKQRGGYYSPDPDYKDDESIYHGYHTYDSFGYQMEHIMEFDEDGKVVRENDGRIYQERGCCICH